VLVQHINVGKADELKFERHADVGFTLTAPNGTQIFLTDDMLDQLFSFQRDSYIREAEDRLAAITIDGDVL
jgi:hypothetical protein